MNAEKPVISHRLSEPCDYAAFKGIDGLLAQVMSAATARGVNKIRQSSFDEYIEWYLRRDHAKGDLRQVPESAFSRRVTMESTKHGKLWPGCAGWGWSLVELEVSALPNLLILASDWTRDERLIREDVPRTLGNAARHAAESGYFEKWSEARARHHGYFEAFRAITPSSSEFGRIVVRDFRDDSERGDAARARPTASYYLHDGLGRCLPFLALLDAGAVSPIRIEAFLASEKI